MKKLILLLISALLVIGPMGCSEKIENDSLHSEGLNVKAADVREAVYNSLETQDRKRIQGSWKDACATKILLSQEMGTIYDKAFIGKEIYLVEFETKDLSIHNQLIVYASLSDFKIIGRGYID